MPAPDLDVLGDAIEDAIRRTGAAGAPRSGAVARTRWRPDGRRLAAAAVVLVAVAIGAAVLAGRGRTDDVATVSTPAGPAVTVDLPDRATGAADERDAAITPAEFTDTVFARLPVAAGRDVACFERGAARFTCTIAPAPTGAGDEPARMIFVSPDLDFAAACRAPAGRLDRWDCALGDRAAEFELVSREELELISDAG